MPLVQVHTNVAVSEEQSGGLLVRLTTLLAEHTGKAEKWVMVRLVPGQTMSFAGSRAPTAYVEIKNLGGFEAPAAEALCAALCDALEEALAIPAARVYVEMADPPRHLFGWNRGTFA